MANFEISPGKMIGSSYPCYIIAEIGQNHQGSVEIATKLIKSAYLCGANCVKLQKSNLDSRFNSAALSRPYIGPNSWGNTYGEHRKYLEFSADDFIGLQKYAHELGITFTASATDKESIDFLNNIGVPFFKIGSGDANNLPLLQYTAELGKPVIVSTGMQEMNTVYKMHKTVTNVNKHLGIMQCTSCYPTPAENVNLSVIKVYETEFPDAVIGYSGHETGIGISIAAVALGAKIIERHLTLDRSWKGSDHIASLEPQEFKQLVQEIRKVEHALVPRPKQFEACELDCYLKLGKTVVTSQFIPNGTLIKEHMLDIKVAEPKGWKAEDISKLIGKQLLRCLKKDSSIMKEDVRDCETF